MTGDTLGPYMTYKPSSLHLLPQEVRMKCDIFNNETRRNYIYLVHAMHKNTNIGDTHNM